jgi:uncharacterized protein (TIGR02246 family)
VQTTTTDEVLIRALIDDRIEATRIKDVARAGHHISQNVSLFDVVGPLRQSGIEALTKRSEEWFASFDGTFEFEITDLNVAVGGDTAFSHGLHHVRATTKAGGRLDMWWRCTVCYRNRDGTWTVTHEHNSVPFDPATGRASADLQA